MPNSHLPKIKRPLNPSDPHFLLYHKKNLSLHRQQRNNIPDNTTSRFEKLDSIKLQSDINCVSWSKETFCGYGIIAAGMSNGAVDLCLYDILDSELQKTPNTQHTAQNQNENSLKFLSKVINIAPESGKPCNDIALNPFDPKRLVAGFEMSLNEPSIKVFDIVRQLGVQNLDGGEEWLSKRLNSLLFHNFVPDLTIPSRTINQRVHKPWADDLALEFMFYEKNRYSGTKFPNFVSEQCSIKSTAWVPKYPFCVAAGVVMGPGSIRIYDTNSPQATSSIAFYENHNSSQSKPGAIYGIEFDPFSQYRFMAHNKNHTIQIYDLRWPFSCITLDTKSKLGSGILEAHYCTDRKDSISVLGANQPKVMLWSLSQNRKESALGILDDTSPLSSTININYIQDQGQNQTQNQSKEKNQEYEYQMNNPSIPAKVLLTSFSSPIASHNTQITSFVPISLQNPTNSPTKLNPKSHSLSTKLLLHMIDGTFSTYEIPVIQEAIISPTGEISFLKTDKNKNKNKNYQVKQTSTRKDVLLIETINLISKSETSSQGSPPVQMLTFPQNIDILPLMHKRAKSGYAFNPSLNMACLTKDSSLWMLWRWIRDANNLNNSQVLSENNFELSFSGIYSILMTQNTRFTNFKDKFAKSALSSVFFATNPDLSLSSNHTNNSVRVPVHSLVLKVKQPHAMETGHVDSFNSRQGILSSGKHTSQIIDAGEPSPGFAAGPDSKLSSNFKKSYFTLQRYACLLLCGCDLSKPMLELYLQKLIAEGNIIEAISTCFLYGRHDLVIGILTKSKSSDYQILGCLLAEQFDEITSSLTPFKSKLALSTVSILEKIFDNPTIQVVFDYLKSGNWMRSIRNKTSLGFLNRIILSLVYLDDNSLLDYLKDLYMDCCLQGRAEGLILTGIQGDGLLLLTNYVNNTSDVQTAALVSGIWPQRDILSNDQFYDKASLSISEQWKIEYRNFLIRWEMFNEKCMFDVSIGDFRLQNGLPRLSPYMELVVSRTVNVRCTFCRTGIGYSTVKRNTTSKLNKSNNSSSSANAMLTFTNSAPKSGDLNSNSLANGREQNQSHIQNQNQNQAHGQTQTQRQGSAPALPKRPSTVSANVANSPIYSRVNYTHCPKCFNKLPNCSVCRMPLGTPKIDSFDLSDNYTGETESQSSLDNWFVWCQNCGHGGHYSHIKDWFLNLSICSALDCDCRCNFLGL